jgi:thiol:disulfide interchange protein DsbD
VRILRILLICLGACLPIVAAHAAHTQAQLLLADESARPGDTVLAAVQLKMEPEWHTYWKNPGAAGMATTIEWQLPAGVTAGEIQWPLPQKLPPAEVTTYGYENETVLLVPLKLAADLKPGPLALKAKVSWLECKEQCIPAGGNVEATLTVASEIKPSGNTSLIDSWREKTPTADGPVKGLGYTNVAWWEKAAAGDTRPVIIERRSLEAAAAPVSFDRADFFPDAGDGYDIQPMVDKIVADSSDIKLRVFVKKYSGDWPKEISGVLVTESHGQRQGMVAHFSIAGQAPAGAAVSAPASATESLPEQSLWKMLLYAFVGGLILNIMPCVLPVIALKIVGFVSEAHNEPGRVRMLGIVYSLGVLASFLAMAGLVIGIKAAGHRAGWGMQFSNPYFLIVLTVLVTLVALNLFGIFEINLNAGTLTAAGSLASRHGASGAFFNGVLATILATPCTASLLGTALGFAFAQGPVVIVAMFLVMGAGLAFPYLLLSWNPAWLKFLPKPGAWMEKFKIAMGFPMLATAIWLFNVTSIHYGARSWWLAIFLVFVAIAAWIYGEFVQRGRRHRGLAFCAMIVVLVTGYCWALNSQLQWNRPVEAETGGNSQAMEGAEAGWEPWSPAAIAKARSEARPILVDFTAKWCVTCNSVVAPALRKSSVQDKFKETNARVFVADYSLTPPEISDELARYGRAGVPLVLVYPKDPSKPAIVLQEPGPFELPSHYASAVISALDEAVK